MYVQSRAPRSPMVGRDDENPQAQVRMLKIGSEWTTPLIRPSRETSDHRLGSWVSKSVFKPPRARSPRLASPRLRLRLRPPGHVPEVSAAPLDSHPSLPTTETKPPPLPSPPLLSSIIRSDQIDNILSLFQVTPRSMQTQCEHRQ